MARTEDRPKPVLHPEYCKGCERCLGACAHHCLVPGDQINPLTGLVPVQLHLEACNGCGLCVDACPEPYGLVAGNGARAGAVTRVPPPRPVARPAERIPLPVPEGRPFILKGAYASALGALLAGCRHFFGYPITPSTEGAEYMARALPELGGEFVQAVSEVAAVNMLYGCGGAGLPCMTFTSSPGLSLMLEGVSFLIGSEVPCVIVNVMRGGPGLGNIAPEQSDIKLVCRGLGHGSTHAVVLAPATPQEMLDFTQLAFELAFKYRNPVVVVADGYLGQMTGKVLLPSSFIRPGLPEWAVWGDAAHRGNLISSIYLSETDLEAHNLHLQRKYLAITKAEQRADLYRCDDAEVLVVACNTPARMAKGAVRALREEGILAGLFRPQTLWPFPIKKLLPLLDQVRRVVVVEAGDGQLEDELRLALSHAGAGAGLEIRHVRRCGGVLPSQKEIVAGVQAAARRKGAQA
jgi:pyruvate/2-oxoacid:ferredoxin oxidoreductase alpha subunit/NAD-dependent dihydropyrimidine dehydrogenase PreA subunit